MIVSARETETGSDHSNEYSYLNFVTDSNPCLSNDEIREATDKDQELKRIKQYIQAGWLDRVDKTLEVYKRRDLQLTIESGCVMWGYRIVVPTSLRNKVLNELHEAHFGIVKMKMLARSYIWWPNLDKDIERATKTCKLCVENADNPPRAALHSWTWPAEQRLHIDFCGPIDNYMYLIIIDSFSKWVDVKELNNIKAESTMNALREYFSTWGIPSRIVSDNGPTFVSDKFRSFLKNNGISHTLTAPYHPSSNGAAENSVKYFKNKFKLLITKMSRREALSKYLFAIRSTIHCTTGVTPTELQIGRKFRTRLDMFKPSVGENVLLNQEKQRQYFKGGRNVTFVKDDLVVARNYSGTRWLNATVIDQYGPVTYVVRTVNNQMWKRHVDQLRPRSERHTNSARSEESVNEQPIADLYEYENMNVQTENDRGVNESEATKDRNQCDDNSVSKIQSNIVNNGNKEMCVQVVTERVVVRRSERIKKQRIPFNV